MDIEKYLLTDTEISSAIRFDPEVKFGAEYQELSHRFVML